MNPATLGVAAGGAGRGEFASMREDRARSALGDATIAPFGAQLAGLLVPDIGLASTIGLSPGTGSGAGAVASQLDQFMRSASADPTLLEGAATARAREALRTAPSREGVSSTQREPIAASQAETGQPRAVQESATAQGVSGGDVRSAGERQAPSSDQSRQLTVQSGPPSIAQGQPMEGASQHAGAGPLPQLSMQGTGAADAVARAVQAAAAATGAKPSGAVQATPSAAALSAGPAARATAAAKPRAAAAPTHAPKQPPIAQLASALAKALKRGDGTVELTLRPSALGQVRVSLAIEGAQVSARFEARAESAQQLLSQSVDQLRAQLAHRGLVLQEVEVVLSEGERDGGLEREAAGDRPASPPARHATTASQGRASQSEEIDLTPMLLASGRVDMLA